MIAPLRESRRQFQVRLDYLMVVVRTMAAEASQASHGRPMRSPSCSTANSASARVARPTRTIVTTEPSH